MPDTFNDMLFAQPSPRIQIGDMDYITLYNPNNENETQGFIERLREQGTFHRHPVPKERAIDVANMSGELFRTTLVCGEMDGKKGIIVKGMTTTTVADVAAGKVLYLEDLVVAEAERRRGYGRNLVDSNLIHSWNMNLDGMAWETGRENAIAQEFYVKIDPYFNVESLNEVWRLSARQCAQLAFTDGRRAELATLRNLTSISDTLRDQPDINLGRLSEILNEQQYNGMHANSFIVSSEGGLLIVSKAYSTFAASMRLDGRLHLAAGCDAEDISTLMRGAAVQIARRGLRGHMHIELNDNIISIDYTRSLMGKKRAAMAAKTLKENLGAELLVDDSVMVPYQTTGKRYVAAVIEAVKHLPQAELADGARGRLIEAARNYSLEFPRAVAA